MINYSMERSIKIWLIEEKSVENGPEIIQVIKLVDKYIERVIITISYV